MIFEGAVRSVPGSPVARRHKYENEKRINGLANAALQRVFGLNEN